MSGVQIPPAFCGGLIEVSLRYTFFIGCAAIPPAFCGGLIEVTPS